MPGHVDCSDVRNRYLNDTQLYPETVCLSSGDVVGLAFQAQCGLFSFVGLGILAAVIIRNYRRNTKELPKGTWLLLRSNMDILTLNLLFADTLQTLGAIFSAAWAFQRQTYTGGLCNVQGAFQFIGATSTALSMLSIIGCTAAMVRSEKRLPFMPQRCLTVICVIWLWVLCWSLLPMSIYNERRGLWGDSVAEYYAPAPSWCWINREYLSLRIIAQYFWIWSTCIITLVASVPTYLHLRKDPNTARSKYTSKLLLYPLSYTILALPLALVRWIEFIKPSLLAHPSANAATLVFSSASALVGLAHAVITLWARPGLLLVGSDGKLSADDPRLGGGQVVDGEGAADAARRAATNGKEVDPRERGTPRQVLDIPGLRYQ